VLNWSAIIVYFFLFVKGKCKKMQKTFKFLENYLFLD